MGDAVDLPRYVGDRSGLDGKAILVTGGTGSFGSAFVRYVLARYKPRRLVVFSRDEAKQHDLSVALRRENGGTWPPCLRFFIGDVRDLARLQVAFQGMDIIVHAAAMKQVVASEYNPGECIRTNVTGAEHVVEAALANDVGMVMALSTDKAVNPINLYGASKLAAEKIFIAANNYAGRRPTRFSVVRYGNVLGSRGSVVPVFRDLIARGATTLPITDARMTRFWITLEQGVCFVLFCLGLARGGEIFVPKIASMKITDLARVMAPALPVEVIGIRPGEKLHEVLISADEARETHDIGACYMIDPATEFWEKPAHAVATRTAVADDFLYSSDSNRVWLADDQLQAMLANLA